MDFLRPDTLLMAAAASPMHAGFYWGDWAQSVVVATIFILGLFAHYIKTEEKQRHRYENLAKWLEQHERRLCELEGRNYQPTGLTTYMPRLECETKHAELKSEFRNLVKEFRATQHRGGGS